MFRVLVSDKVFPTTSIGMGTVSDAGIEWLQVAFQLGAVEKKMVLANFKES